MSYFKDILDEVKTFEIRLADFECEKGDIILLREWNPSTKQYTGRELIKEVGYVVRTKDLQSYFWNEKDIRRYGFQIMSLKDCGYTSCHSISELDERLDRIEKKLNKIKEKP